MARQKKPKQQFHPLDLQNNKYINWARRQKLWVRALFFIGYTVFVCLYCVGLVLLWVGIFLLGILTALLKKY